MMSLSLQQESSWTGLFASFLLREILPSGMLTSRGFRSSLLKLDTVLLFVVCVMSVNIDLIGNDPPVDKTKSQSVFTDFLFL